MAAREDLAARAADRGDGGAVGVIGLGVMGGNLARNLSRNGLRVVGYNRDPEHAKEFVRAHPDAELELAVDIEDLLRRLPRPRRVLLMVSAGSAVDEVLDALDPRLEEDDVVLDGGNSHYADTDRRCERAASRSWRFVGMGVSGGADGALHGPSIMPGGDATAWPAVRGMLERIAAQSESGPCVAWCGARSAGHFVKMVHNGIEYAEMQHLAEAALLLRRGLGLGADAVADLFEAWNGAELESFLVEISAAIFRKRDPRSPHARLVDAILDRAGQKGTGRWTVQVALELGVALPSIAAAVDARVLSAQLELRRRAAEELDGSGREALQGVTPDDVRASLFAARIVAYSQGFELIAAASAAFDYGTDPAEVARIWKAGCIIRARLLEDARQALADGEATPLALAPRMRGALQARLPAWRRLVSAAARAGFPIPGLSASWSWLETLSTKRGSAYLIQAQRDYFGAHRYERIDDPGNLVHTDWTGGD